MSDQRRNDDALKLEEEATAEEEVLKLHEEVEGMTQRILEYRTTLPDQLSSTLASVLVSQRPVLPPHLAYQIPDPGTRTPHRPDSGVTGTSEMMNMALVVLKEPQEAEKIKLLKQKISSNVSNLPIFLKRLKECMVRVGKLDSANGIMHPAFKRRWPS